MIPRYQLLEELERKATAEKWSVQKWRGLSTDGPMIIAEELKSIPGAKKTASHSELWPAS